MRLSKKPSVQERIRNARCSAVMVRLTAPALANGPKYRPGRDCAPRCLRICGAQWSPDDQDIGKRLVVAQLHVEARPQLLDQIGLEQQRLGLGRGRDDLDRNGRRDHAQDARRQWRVDAGIGGKPLADVLRLADVEHVVAGVEHAIDAGRGRRQAHGVFDRGMADRQRAFGHGLSGVPPPLPAGGPHPRPPAPPSPDRHRPSPAPAQVLCRSFGGKSGWEPRRACAGPSAGR